MKVFEQVTMFLAFLFSSSVMEKGNRKASTLSIIKKKSSIVLISKIIRSHKMHNTLWPEKEQ